MQDGRQPPRPAAPLPELERDGSASAAGTAWSVVIATFDAAEHLPAAIRSALNQSPAPAEVVVCDDASSDATAEVLASFGDAVRVVRHPVNRGEAAAKNSAVAASTSPFVVFLDADDEFLPGRLAALEAALRQDPGLDVVTTDALLVQGDVTLGRWYGPTNPLPGPDVRRTVLAYNPVFGHAAVRRSAFLDAGGFDETIRYATDWDLWIRMVLSGSRLGVVDEPLSLYRMHGGNVSADRPRMLASAVELLTRTAAQADLSASEQAVLAQTIAEHRRVLSRAQLKAALLDGGPEVRRLAVTVARDGGQPRRSRLLAMGAAALPRAAAGTWRRRTSGTWTGPGGRQLKAHG